MDRITDLSDLPADALLDDRALAEALNDWRDRGRLSNEAVRAMKRRRRRTASGAIGAVLAIAIAVGVTRYQSPPEAQQVARIETQRGQFRTVRLVDGTTIRLNGATRLDVRYAGDRRQVTLAMGEAFFDVAHEETRPFEVDAGDAEIRVLGTAFNVDRTEGRIDLAVYRGAVRFAGLRDERGARVAAGWRGRVVGGHAGLPVRFDPTQADWRQNWLDTSDMRLDELVTMLNRRSGPLLRSPPPALADVKVTGRFRINDPKKLMELLGKIYQFRVEVRRDEIFISKN